MDLPDDDESMWSLATSDPNRFVMPQLKLHTCDPIQRGRARKSGALRRRRPAPVSWITRELGEVTLISPR
jgi:hypothetical protein